MEFPNRFKITVTNEDIACNHAGADGVRCTVCPVARAGTRALDLPMNFYVSVTSVVLTIWEGFRDPLDGRLRPHHSHAHYRLPHSVTEFIKKADLERELGHRMATELRPISFEVRRTNL